VFSILRN